MTETINFKFKLELDPNKNKLYLNIYDKNNKLIDNKSYWDYYTLKEKLYRKLKYLAVIKTNKKIINNEIFFKYYQIDIYKLKSFDNFLELIKKGKIRVTFKASIHKNLEKLGMLYDHGTGFDIKEYDLFKLYTHIKKYPNL